MIVDRGANFAALGFALSLPPFGSCSPFFSFSASAPFVLLGRGGREIHSVFESVDSFCFAFGPCVAAGDGMSGFGLGLGFGFGFGFVVLLSSTRSPLRGCDSRESAISSPIVSKVVGSHGSW